MEIRKLILVPVFLAYCGCENTQPKNVPSATVPGVTVSADAPVILGDDGTQIGVDGLTEGQSIDLQIIETTNPSGESVVDIDLATDKN